MADAARPERERGRRWARVADASRIGGLACGTALSFLIPQRLDHEWTDFLDRTTRRLARASVETIAGRMRQAFADDAMFDPDRAARDFWRMRIEDSWGRSRGLRRFGWKPRVWIEGLERVEQVLSRGRGAVLWGMRLASATAIKQAFYHAGHPLVHLSRAQHGSPTDSLLGVRVAARLYSRAENPYLSERVVIPLDGSPGYLKTLRRRLSENACLSIFGEHAGRQNIERPILTTRLELALGAPSLAWSEGAALLTVSAHREAPLAYRIEVDEEIPVDASMPRKAFAEQAIDEFARRLEGKIRKFPSDWQGWTYHEFLSPDGVAA